MPRKSPDASTTPDTRPNDSVQDDAAASDDATSAEPVPTEKPKPGWVELFNLDGATAKAEEIQDIIDRDMATVFGKEPLVEETNVRLFFDSRPIGSP